MIHSGLTKEQIDLYVQKIDTMRAYVNQYSNHAYNIIYERYLSYVNGFANRKWHQKIFNRKPVSLNYFMRNIPELPVLAQESTCFGMYLHVQFYYQDTRTHLGCNEKTMHFLSSLQPILHYTTNPISELHQFVSITRKFFTESNTYMYEDIEKLHRIDVLFERWDKFNQEFGHLIKEEGTK